MQFRITPGTITCIAASGIIWLGANWVAATEPYIPTDDDEVLEVLPRSLLATRGELATFRQQLAAAPDDAELASKVAASYIQLGNLEGDPRFYGYARAAIQAWWDDASPPSAILKLRAKLKEKDHRYDQALADLKLLLEKEPRDVQAWIELSNICRVQGKYDEARQAGDSLGEFAGSVPAILCHAPIMALTGQAEAGYDALARALPTAKERWPSAVGWMMTVQAEISRALGHLQRAEQLYRVGLANNPRDKYLIRVYADFLLDENRAKEAITLLRDHTSDTGILLRAAIAARNAGEQQLAADWQSQLERRFEEIRLRGSKPHGRFEARCALELQNDPQRALALGMANWQKQKEMRDSRIVLEAAIATAEVAAAKPVLGFLTKHGTEDVILQRLARQLESD